MTELIDEKLEEAILSGKNMATLASDLIEAGYSVTASVTTSAVTLSEVCVAVVHPETNHILVVDEHGLNYLVSLEHAHTFRIDKLTTNEKVEEREVRV